MAVYDWSQLNRMWDGKKITEKQAIGQLLQWGQKMHESALAAQWEIAILRQEVEALSVEVVALTQRLDKEE